MPDRSAAVPALLRRAEPEDSAMIAALHIGQIHWGQLSQMGDEFVGAFYRALIRSPLGFGFVAERDGRLAGFASGVVNWRLFYREFVRRHVWLSARMIVSSLRKARWGRLLRTTRYAASSVLPPAELVSIALEPSARGAGVASALVQAVLDEFVARGVRAVRVTAGDSNQTARQLYERMGFVLHSRFEMHPGEPAAVYVVTLDASGWRPAAFLARKAGHP